jgi:hypothetical protein
MSKTFRAWRIDEPLFLPPTVGDFVAKDHLARFVLSLVRDEVDLAAMDLRQRAGSAAVRPHHDDGAAAVCILLRHLRLAPDRQGVP